MMVPWRNLMFLEQIFAREAKLRGQVYKFPSGSAHREKWPLSLLARVFYEQRSKSILKNRVFLLREPRYRNHLQLTPFIFIFLNTSIFF